jgi:hypothetical protein
MFVTFHSFLTVYYVFITGFLYYYLSIYVYQLDTNRLSMLNICEYMILKI